MEGPRRALAELGVEVGFATWSRGKGVDDALKARSPVIVRKEAAL